jgi:CDP-diacylglycerol--glycerol-3-phosphate 3-phosphatidyltransferase
MFLSQSKTLNSLASLLFLVGALSDYFDGLIARKYKLESKWGVFIDPLADKILTTVAFVAFVFIDVIPFWMVIIIVLRDFTITFLRLFADSHNMSIKTSSNAKIKTFLQFSYFAIIMSVTFFTNLEFLTIEFQNLLFKSYLLSTVNYLLTLFTVYTLLEYLHTNKILIYKLFGVEQN